MTATAATKVNDLTGDVYDIPAKGSVRVAETPWGRDIRLTSRGTFEAQPRNDNYWIERDEYSEICDAIGCWRL